MILEKNIQIPPFPGVTNDNLINQVHTLTTDIAVTQLTLSGYGKENQCTYTHTDFYQNIGTHFDSSSGVDLSTFEMSHRHGYFEMLLVLEGELDIVVEGTKVHYRRGDLCLLNRNTKHHEEFRGDFKINYFCFSQHFVETFSVSFGSTSGWPQNILRFFRQNLDDNSQKNKDYIDFILKDRSIRDLEAASIWNQIKLEMSERQPGFELFINGWLNRLFALLENHDIYRFEPKSLGLLSDKNITDEVIYYINAQKRRITREEVSEILSYNGDYINRVFKKQTGRSILNYCQTVCMEEAARLLSTTSLDVQTIIKQMGYENRTHFNRLFKEYFQMTPGEYRVRHRIALKKLK